MDCRVARVGLRGMSSWTIFYIDVLVLVVVMVAGRVLGLRFWRGEVPLLCGYPCTARSWSRVVVLEILPVLLVRGLIGIHGVASSAQ
jgi:hypothetical protein